MKRRYFPVKEDCVKGTKYDSKFEKDLDETLLADAFYHSREHHVSYTIPHHYEPDWTYIVDGKIYYIEAKGRFQDNNEARKYLCIREALRENEELVFIMYKANTRYPFAKRRKDGTYATHEEWLEKHGFRYWIHPDFDLTKL